MSERSVAFYGSIEKAIDSMSISYHNGKKHVDGEVFEATRIEHFKSSNGVTVYSTTLWSDGTASCNCPGFAQHKAKACKHTKAVLAGKRGDATVQVYAAPTQPKAKVDDKPKRRKIDLFDE